MLPPVKIAARDEYLPSAANLRHDRPSLCPQNGVSPRLSHTVLSVNEAFREVVLLDCKAVIPC